jgi:hypothetical protein
MSAMSQLHLCQQAYDNMEDPACEEGDDEFVEEEQEPAEVNYEQ